jgi:flagellar biosynthesis repressor protein FlbT
MALKITLKPGERVLVGGAVVKNAGRQTSTLIVENAAPVLREKDILGEKEADTPCSRIYFIIQLMYIDPENLAIHHESYWKLVRPLLEAAPRLTGVIDRINQHILNGKYYPALKLAAELIAYEKEITGNVQ